MGVNDAPRVVFVTRRFPPSVGGMETLAADVWKVLQERHPDAVLVAHGGSERGLPLFVLRAWWRIASGLARRRYDVVVTGDALMSALLWPLTACFRVTTVTMVMGLDLTWPHRAYTALIRATIPRADAVVAISRATADAARELGVADDRLSIARLGVDAPVVTPEDRRVAREQIHERLQLPDETIVLVTIGRLIARKGVRWFVAEVLADLPPSVHYAVVGTGPEADAIRAAAVERDVASRVHLLGRVDDATREEVLRGADLFVQPNVRVPGDMEGFGLAVVESARRGTPVVASALEGLLDAVVPDETGVVCPPEDAVAWRATVGRLVDGVDARASLAALGQRFQRRAGELYGLDAVGAALDGAIERASHRRTAARG